MSLERETQQYRMHLNDLLGSGNENEGKFTVISGDQIKGPFDTFEQALEFGYRTYGLEPFLAKKIEREETVMFFAHGLP